ncbi:MAG TPA: amino acid permease, partial [Prosthecobacter sp.]
MSSPSSSRAGVSLMTATAVVVANMIGTGVFTSLGYQVGGLPSGFVIALLWAVGGLCAFCGALAYGELAAALPRSGGEYHFLSRTFHPAAGFVAGWLSATVGFAAPIALAAMAFGKYFTGIFPSTSALYLSIAVSVAVTIIHLFGIQVAARFQNLATWGKVTL